MKEILLDFDGTVVEHSYPLIGRHNPFALETIKKLQDKGHCIILNTTRVIFKDGTLLAALDYLNKNPLIKGINIKYYTSNKIEPLPWRIEALRHTDTIFIDDMAQGIPIIRTSSNAFMVDWTQVEKDLFKAGILD